MCTEEATASQFKRLNLNRIGKNDFEKATEDDQLEDEQTENASSEIALEIAEAEEHLRAATANEETGEVEEAQPSADDESSGDPYAENTPAPAPALQPQATKNQASSHSQSPRKELPHRNRSHPERLASNLSAAAQPRRCSQKTSSAPLSSDPVVDDGFDSPGHSDATAANSTGDSQHNWNNGFQGAGVGGPEFAATAADGPADSFNGSADDWRNSVHVIKSRRINKRLNSRVNELPLPVSLEGTGALSNVSVSGRVTPGASSGGARTPTSSGRQTPNKSNNTAVTSSSSAGRHFDSNSASINGRPVNTNGVQPHAAANAYAESRGVPARASCNQFSTAERGTTRSPYESVLSVEEQAAAAAIAGSQNLGMRSHSLPSAELPSLEPAGDAEPSPVDADACSPEAAELEWGFRGAIGLFTTPQLPLDAAFNLTPSELTLSQQPPTGLSGGSQHLERGRRRGGYGASCDVVANVCAAAPDACGDPRCNARHKRQHIEEHNGLQQADYIPFNANGPVAASAATVRAPVGRSGGPINRNEVHSAFGGIRSAPARHLPAMPQSNSKLEPEPAADGSRSASNQIGPRFRANGGYYGLGGRQSNGGNYAASCDTSSMNDPTVDSWSPNYKQPLQQQQQQQEQYSFGREYEYSSERNEPNHLKQGANPGSPTGLTVKLNSKGGRRTVLTHSNAHPHSHPHHAGGPNGFSGGAAAATAGGWMAGDASGCWSGAQPAEEESEVIPREELDRYRVEAARMKAERERLREQLRHKFEQLVSNKNSNA